METLQVELSDKVVAELETLIQDGWFADKKEIVRLALLEFVREHRFELAERFQREDIAWALTQKQARP